MVKLSTTKRKIDGFAGMDVTRVRSIANNRTNPSLVRGLLNKPHLSDASAKAQGRLAKQYLDLTANPSPTEIQHVQQITGKTLTGNVTQNQVALGNRAPVGGSGSTRPRPPKGWRHAQKLYPPAGPLGAQIANLLPRVTRVLTSGAWAGDSEYQIIIKVRLSNGWTSFISSKVFPLTSRNGVARAFAWLTLGPPPGPKRKQSPKTRKNVVVDEIVWVQVRWR
jgi:hypothetical protein